jgi:hypothetical protein
MVANKEIVANGDNDYPKDDKTRLHDKMRLRSLKITKTIILFILKPNLHCFRGYL